MDVRIGRKGVLVAINKIFCSLLLPPFDPDPAIPPILLTTSYGYFDSLDVFTIKKKVTTTETSATLLHTSASPL